MKDLGSNRSFGTVLYSLVGHLHNYITNAGMTGILDSYIENANDTYGLVRFHLQNRTGVNGFLFEQLGSVDLADFVFKTLTQQSNIRFEARPGFLINALNTTGEWQFGPTGTPWLVLGATTSEVQTNLNVIGTLTQNGVAALLSNQTCIPAGMTTQVMFNNAGVMAGDADFIWNPVTKQLLLGSVTVPGVFGSFGGTTDPTAEPTVVLHYTKSLAGRYVSKWVGPDAIDYVTQPCLGFTNIRQVGPASGTTAATCMAAINTAYTNVATTITQPVIASTSVKTKVRSVTLATSASTGQITSHRSTMQEALGATGYFFSQRFYLQTMQTGNRGFFGLWGNALVATNINPLTDITVAKVGLAFALNTGNWQLVCSTTTAVTSVDLGSTMPLNTTDVMELVLFNAVGSPTYIGYTVNNLSTGATVSGTLSTNVPISTVPLAINNWMTNNATAAIVSFGLNKWYLETDF